MTPHVPLWFVVETSRFIWGYGPLLDYKRNHPTHRLVFLELR
jgi:hypothetical protein